MRPALFIFVAFALISCGQQTQTAEAPASTSHPARDPNAPPPVPMTQSTGGPCRTLTTPAPATGLESVGTVGPYTISATPRTLACSEPALDRVDCSATGPGEIYVSGPSAAAFALDAGQSGTFAVGADGAQCHLNANGG